VIWNDPPHPALPPLDGAAACDVLVVGGGLAGTAAAAFLARRGASVILLERDRLASGATGASLGIVGSPSARSYADASHFLGRPTARLLWSLARRTRRLLADLGVEHRVRGGIERGSDERSALLLREDGFPAEPRPDGLFLPDHAELDPVLLVCRLAALARDAGARLHESSPVTLERADPPLATTPRGRVEAEMVLVAAHTSSASFATLLESVVFPVRAAAIATAPLGERVLDVPVTAAGGRASARQLDDGRIVALGDAEALVGRPLRAATRWSVPMAMSCDEVPSAGPLPGSVRLYALAGFHGRGLALAPACAEVVASLMLDGRAGDEARALDPRRHAG
jgi:gamma-glutamylputrescine oxidase